MGQRTLSGEAHEGWFIPYRHAVESDDRRTNAVLLDQFAAWTSAFTEILESIAKHRNGLLAIGISDAAPGPRWDQDWFAGLDAAAAYALVAEYRPGKIVEVGSGHSTRFMTRAISDGGLNCNFTSIDPAPRADISALPVDLIQSVVQDADRGLFNGFQAGDVLFIDSSHILMPGTDVDLLFGEVIPSLPAGALVHVHDIFLPFAYPTEWQLRGYNEQNALAPMIAGGMLKPLLPCQYVVREMADAYDRHCGFIPRPRPNHDASMWLMRC
jgi:hypothetical protein